MTLEFDLDFVDDRFEIFEFICADKPQAAIDVDDRIMEAVRSLKRFPEKGRPGRTKGTRELVIPNTRYLAQYKIEEDTIVVLRVIDGGRRWPRKKTRH